MRVLPVCPLVKYEHIPSKLRCTVTFYLSSYNELLAISEDLSRLGVRLRASGFVAEASTIENVSQSLSNEIYHAKLQAATEEASKNDNSTPPEESVTTTGTPDLEEVRGKPSILDRFRSL